MFDLESIKKRCEKATNGPWIYHGITRDGFIAVEIDKAHMLEWDIEGSCSECFSNMKFIAHARTDIPRLIVEIERLQQLLAQSEKGKQ